MRIEPLSSATGGKVLGVDLGRALTAELSQALSEALAQYSLLLFQSQQLDDTQQLAVGRVFGKTSTLGEAYEGTNGIRFVSNVADEGLAKNGELTFHVDHSFYAVPDRAIMLYGLEVPPPGSGGATLFANMQLAYEALPERLRVRIAGLRGLHCCDHRDGRPAIEADRFRERDLGADAPRAVHPLVLDHPVTGRKILYLSRRHVDRILGLSEVESEALIDELLTYMHRPESIYRHEWQSGDLVIWDNFALQHARTHFEPNLRRHLRRTQVA